ncbi:MAG: hypothetical protein M2R45_03602 [Verrucomicrobia subdivision 3 bacterium]|nr:hypothetical protein [Limisphaerales bacterium]MCS1416903.1 hypothetical protein [Limisphaerales bacterium]
MGLTSLGAHSPTQGRPRSPKDSQGIGAEQRNLGLPAHGAIGRTNEHGETSGAIQRSEPCSDVSTLFQRHCKPRLLFLVFAFACFF